MQKATKISYILLLVFVITSIVSAFVAVDIEAARIITTVGLISLALFLISILVNVFTYLWKGKPNDIWKLGWVGLIGLLGFIPGFGVSFFGLYGFYGFFGFKNQNFKPVKK